MNQNGNQSADIMVYLFSQKADLKITVIGIIRGKDYEWKTLIPTFNPVSYAMMGMLPHMQRDEKQFQQQLYF